MLQWVFLFLVLAIIAGFLGFGGISFAASEIAKTLFVIFLVLFIISVLINIFR
jgi:uncharacterized membrane protein YtjA (UPF0391 family)